MKFGFLSRINGVNQININYMKKLLIVIGLMFLFCFLCGTQASAKSEGKKELWERAMDAFKHRRIQESDSIFSKLIDSGKLSRKKIDEAYFWMELNARFAGNFTRASQVRQHSLRDGQDDTLQTNYKTLSTLPPAMVKRPSEDIEVKYILDSTKASGGEGGLIRIPVTIAGKEEYCILDNGFSEFGAVDSSFAKEHNIRSTGFQVNLYGTVGTEQAEIGIADSLSIGGMKLYNLLFAIIPDMPQMDTIMRFDAVLGANFFRLVGEVDFYGKEGKLVFPSRQKQCESNICLHTSGQCYIEEMKVNGKYCPMCLDLGADRTRLNSNYYKVYKSRIKRRYQQKNRMFGGVGGIKERLVYIVPEMEVEFLGKKFVVRDATIKTDSDNGTDLGGGSLGNDFIKEFSKVSLNLQRMYLLVE